MCKLHSILSGYKARTLQERRLRENVGQLLSLYGIVSSQIFYMLIDLFHAKTLRLKEYRDVLKFLRRRPIRNRAEMSKIIVIIGIFAYI